MSRYLSMAVLGGLSLASAACMATDSRADTGADGVTSAPAAIPKSPFAPIVKQVSPAVVSIDTVSPGGDPVPWIRETPEGTVAGLASPERRGAGSGFFISADGYIVTNDHVIAGAQEITVSLSDGRQFPARLVGTDPPTDIAVLKVAASDLPYVSFAPELPEVGEWVVARGNPVGFGGTAPAGIVSAHGREIGEAHVGFLQIDAPINSGNSGGPTFDLKGRVVGVNTAIITPSGGSVGIGLAVPADLASEITQELIRTGRVARGYLGLGIQDLTPAMAARLNLRGQRGALITTVSPTGPAAKALRPGDVVVAVDGETVESAGTLTRTIAAATPGTPLRLRVVRGGEVSELTIVADRRPDGI
jgi:serine protease Do